MRIPGLKTAKHFSHWVQARLFGGALILGYHRVANVISDEYQVCVTPKHFAEQMDALKKYAHPISLAKMVENLREGSLHPKSVAVTFDDGYADNLYEAKPVLEKYEIPATIFVCTGYAGQEFWWDELDRLVMSSQSSLGTLCFEVGEKSFMWKQPEVSPEAGLKSRRNFRHALYHFILGLGVEEQSQTMEIVRNWSGVSSDKIMARAMTHDEIVQTATDGLIEIGAHTRSHPMLQQLSLEQQRDEIVSSKQDLEKLLGKRVVGFAYPNGKATVHAKRIIRDADFAFACTSFHNVVRPSSDLYALTRFWQRDVDGKAVLQSLKLWI